MPVRFGVLGPLTVHSTAGEFRTIGPLKSRTLLGALLLEPNRIVPADTLKAALWGDRPPATATASLHNHVARLRRSLGAEGGDRLRARAQGFALHVGDGELDGDDFLRLTRRAQAARQLGDWEGAQQEAAAALALWRGTPFADLPQLAGHPWVTYMQEQRLEALECRFDALLCLGRYDGLAAELGVVIGEHPLREGLYRQLMLVLARTDRQGEALALFHSLRRTLVDELGVEPGPAVQETYQAILQGSDAPDAPAPSPGPEPPATVPVPPRPAQLPAPPHGFVGREDELASGCRTAKAPRAHTAVFVVSGMAGVGKTGFALHLADRLRPAFPDGQLYLNLHGATPGVTPLDPTRALATLLRDLGVGPRLIPADTASASALLRSVLAESRTLLVLDDAASVDQVRPLLPAGPGCTVLITSRQPLATLGAAVHFRLAPLSAQEGALLLQRASGRSWAPADAAQVARLVALCGQLPLALRVIAARLATRKALPVEDLVTRLAAQNDRLDHLELDDLSVRRSLAVAHDALAASAHGRDRDAALALVRIGALDLPDYTAPLLARLMGMPVRRAEDALDRLEEVALVEPIRSGRYAPHDLVRDYARELARRREGRAGHIEAVDRALHWYGARAAQCAAALRLGFPEGDRFKARAAAGGESFGDPAAALRWIEEEIENLLCLVRPGRPDDAVERVDAEGRIRRLQLIEALVPYLHDSGRTEDLRGLTRIAIVLARGNGDRTAEALALRHMASAHYAVGHLGEALLLIDEALALSAGSGDRATRLNLLGNRAVLLGELGRLTEARAALDECLALGEDGLQPLQEAVLLGHQGNIAAHTDARLALSYHDRSREIAVRLDFPVIVQSALCNMGRVLLALGEPGSALSRFDEGLRAADASGVSYWNAEREIRLGRAQALRRLGRVAEAEASCVELLGLSGERRDAYGTGLARYEYGHVLCAAGDDTAAQQQWRLALRALAGTDAAELPALRALVTAEQPGDPAGRRPGGPAPDPGGGAGPPPQTQ